MPADRIQSIVIIGADAAAWLAAATLARVLKPGFCTIRVVEGRSNAAAAFSEVALPSFHRLNGLLGINENDLIQRTRGTFRLGCRFADFGRLGEQYFHSYGPLGAKLDAVPFHHYWNRLRQCGDRTAIEEYSTAAVAAKSRRFTHPSSNRRSVLAHYSYGYHFHAASLTAYLKQYAQAHGVVSVGGEVMAAPPRGGDGFIDALQLDDGSRISADLYIDCVGEGGVLFEQALGSGYQDWRHWLPCDRAVSVAGRGADDPPPYSESAAQAAGWSWRIPLQHGSDNGYAYSSAHLRDDEAAAALVSSIPGSLAADARFVRWRAGRPAKFWDKNCLSLAGSRFEPLESTRLHVVQTGIARLLTLFPVSTFSPRDIEEYNRLTGLEHERIRDLLILHFKATERADSPFWEYCRAMPIPDTLNAKIELFQHSGRIAMFDEEHFLEDSWVAVFLGQNIMPQDYDPLADALDVDATKEALLRMKSMIKSGVDSMPAHAQFIQRHCAAGTDHV